MSRKLHTALAAALLMGSSAAALAANDGQVRANQLLGSTRNTGKPGRTRSKARSACPIGWSTSLAARSSKCLLLRKMATSTWSALCEAQDKCTYKRLIVAFSWDKDDAYGMLVEVPEGLPKDKSPTRHAQYRWLGKPDDGMKTMLQEQLKRDPNWY